MSSTANRLITYPAPEGAIGNSDYTVRVPRRMTAAVQL